MMPAEMGLWFAARYLNARLVVKGTIVREDVAAVRWIVEAVDRAKYDPVDQAHIRRQRRCRRACELLVEYLARLEGCANVGDWEERSLYWDALEAWTSTMYGDEPCVECAISHGVYNPGDVEAKDVGCAECRAEAKGQRDTREMPESC